MNMDSDFQTIAALVVVAVTAVWFVARAFGRRRKPGCGSDCGCASEKLKR